jgi:hypothetical protein
MPDSAISSIRHWLSLQILNQNIPFTTLQFHIKIKKKILKKGENSKSIPLFFFFPSSSEELRLFHVQLINDIT